MVRGGDDGDDGWAIEEERRWRWVGRTSVALGAEHAGHGELEEKEGGHDLVKDALPQDAAGLVLRAIDVDGVVSVSCHDEHRRDQSVPEGKAEVGEEGKGTEVGEEEVDDAEEGDGWRHDAEDEDHGEDQHVH
jgi:hypothetical protein